MKNENGRSPKMYNLINEFLLKPIIYGLYGFSLFFLAIVLAKFGGYYLGSLGTFSIDFTDLNLSLIGFLLMFLINILKNFQKIQNDEV